MTGNENGLSRRTVLTGATATSVLAFLGFDALFGPALATLAVSPNGQLGAGELSTVPGSSGQVPLKTSTATAWLALVEACRQATGVTMVVTSPDGGYRDLQQQQYLYDHPEGPVPIATPGTSTHGWGTAVDIWNRQYSWLTEHAAEFGFSQTFTSEPWHWQHNGWTPPGTPSDISVLEEEEMKIYQITNPLGGMNGASVLLYTTGFAVFESTYWRDRFATRYNLTPTPIDQADFQDECGRLSIPFQKVADKWVAGGGSWSWGQELADRISALSA